MHEPEEEIKRKEEIAKQKVEKWVQQQKEVQALHAAQQEKEKEKIKAMEEEMKKASEIEKEKLRVKHEKKLEKIKDAI